MVHPAPSSASTPRAALLKSGNWAFREESPEEQASRLQERQKQHDFQRRIQFLLVLAALVALFAALAFAAWLVCSDNRHVSDDMRNKAVVAFFSLVSGALGFGVGKLTSGEKHKDG